MTWKAGDTLHGDRYTIERPLGVGGFGITYLARDYRDRQVVIKTLKESLRQEKDFSHRCDRFRDEALRLALCRHPHIVQIENAFQEGDLPCIVMEYVAGQTLWEWVEERGALSEAEGLDYIRQIGSALTTIHEKGLLHRDIQPQNIMMRQSVDSPPNAPRYEAVLIDFGLAREFIPDTSQAYTLVMTHGFAPIEQYIREALRGEFSDVYALAATLYYVLTREIPVSTHARAAKAPLKPPQRFNPKISDATNEAILQAMALKSSDRPQTVRDWLSQLPTIITPDPPARPQLQRVTRENTDDAPVSSHQTPSGNGGAAVLSAPTLSTLASVPLVSVAGVDYGPLREQLAAQHWQRADAETTGLMLKIVGRQAAGWLRLEDLRQFPVEDLRTIDRLWYNGSGGRFGFRIQQQAWHALVGTPYAALADWYAFCDRLGWPLQSLWLDWRCLIFDLETAPSGHLPHPPLHWVVAISALLQRRDFILDGPATQ
ncbi:serine/threonine protein kinase [Trichothermofontia sp.]